MATKENNIVTNYMESPLLSLKMIKNCLNPMFGSVKTYKNTNSPLVRLFDRTLDYKPKVLTTN